MPPMTRRPFVVGDTYAYYGSRDDRYFRLDDTVFEAVDAREDGASYLQEIRYADRPLYDFYRYPIATVKLCREGTFPMWESISFIGGNPESYDFNGYSLVDGSDHVWLYVGTSGLHDEGSTFIFRERINDVIQRILSLQDRDAVDAALAAYGRELDRLR